jgi:O-antigen/teichoic acid export membrane protein
MVAFCIAMQGFLALLDVGLAQVIPREIARAGESRVTLAKKFAVFSRAYFWLALAALALGELAVPWLARDWLKLDASTSTEPLLVLRLAFVMFFFQFWNTVHFGFWNGTQEQHVVNLRQTLFATLKHALAALLVLTWSATAQSYLIAFTAVSALEWLSNRVAISRNLSGLERAVRGADLLQLTRETGWLSLGVLMGMAVSQVDRFALSSLVDIGDYGRYVAVASLGLAFFQFQSPVLNAFLPRLAVELPRGEKGAIRGLSLGIIFLNVVPCVLAAVATPMILRLWIADPEIQRVGTVPLQLIFLAIAVNSVYQVFYQQMIVYGLAKRIVLINAMNVLVTASFLFIMAPKIGIEAGGWAWLLAATVQFAAGAAWAWFFRASGPAQFSGGARAPG